MTVKVIKAIKLMAMPLLFIIVSVSCESDLEGVGTGILDNDLFDTTKETFKVVSYNENDVRVKGNRLGEYLLGVYKNEDMGQLNASIVSQMSFTSSVDFGTEPSIDSIILDIPYRVTKSDEDYVGGASKWQLDSIFGNQDVEYRLSVYELTTFLNTVDPSAPENNLDYYSDDVYDFNPAALYTGLFKPNSTDTVLYVKRPEIIIDEATMSYDIDTIKNSVISPSVKLALDEDFFTTNFLNNPSSFESAAAFVEFFNGLYIEATKVSPSDDTSIMSLNFGQSSMVIYYTNTVSEVRKKQSVNFGFFGVTSNTYTRDYSGSNAEPFLTSPNMALGDKRLYLNGAAGSIALLDLFTEENLDELRSNRWLINEANLIFYIDQNANMDILPERIFLYNHEKGTQLRDAVIEGLAVFGGELERDENGDPEKYTFKITNYLSKVLNDFDPKELSQLGLKVFNPSDVPVQILDVEVQDYSWTPKGIVLHGNDSEDIDKRIQLEVVYTERK
jgi:hypothetical protein